MRPSRLLSQLALCLLALVLSALVAPLVSHAQEQIQSQVDESDPPPPSDVPPPSDSPPPVEPMPAPLAPPGPGRPLQGGLQQNALRGGVEQSALQGGAQGMGLTGGAQGMGLTGGAEDGSWAGSAQQGTMDASRSSPLNAGAGSNQFSLGALNDPDANSQELQINWDRWRNTLMQAIQQGTLAKINVQNDINFVFDPRQNMMVSRYPGGTSAWYSVDVLPDQRIINVRLTSTSNFPSYDQAVLQAINDLQGNPILRYPPGSRRTIVNQESSVKTAGSTQTQNFQFGDVERQRY